MRIEKKDLIVGEDEGSFQFTDEFDFVFSKKKDKNPLTSFRIAFEACALDNQIGYPNSGRRNMTEFLSSEDQGQLGCEEYMGLQFDDRFTDITHPEFTLTEYELQ